LIRNRSLFEDLTGLREGRGEPRRDRVAENDEVAAESASRTADTPR
jgi:hypothetical protein